MRAFAALAAAGLALSACATPPSPDPGGPVAGGDDCAVIAAVAKEHYRFNTTDNPPLPLWLHGEGSDWRPDCGWGRPGTLFPTYYDPHFPRAGTVGPGPIQYVQFKRPRYDGRGAVVETSIMHGPLASMGYECRVHSGFAGWTVGACRNTWIS